MAGAALGARSSTAALVAASCAPSPQRWSQGALAPAIGLLSQLKKAPRTHAPLSVRAKGKATPKDKAMAAPKKLKPGDPLPAGYEQNDPYKDAPARRAGVLLHPTSLPGPYGVGEFGKEAYAFIDWLKTAGCSVWQVLPLVPPGRRAGEDGSPYAGQDANCGNTLLISLEGLVEDGLLDKEDLPEPTPVAKVDYVALAARKDPLITKAAQALLRAGGALKAEMERFRSAPNIAGWLEDAALFAAIDAAEDAPVWWEWPAALRDREKGALKTARRQHEGFIEEFVAAQFLFQRQWLALKAYANRQGIRIIGDMPIYVGGHSADVWANRTAFQLDKTGQPSMVSGVPPDAFSDTGQLWGSPLYDWRAQAGDKYSWWAQRMQRAFELYDEFRIDHFRGLAGYWAIQAGETTAMNGQWRMGPREDFFVAIKAAVGKVDIIAEDLGVITTDVVQLRQAIGAPGMAVLLFAFGGNGQNPHLPHNHEPNQVVYPGTHDNDTARGWWKRAGQREKDHVRQYLQKADLSEGTIAPELVRCAYASVARTAIASLQDVLNLDNSARMNTPAVQAGNWGWRVGEPGVFEKLSKEAKTLRDLAALYNRLPKEEGQAQPKAVDSTQEQDLVTA